MDKTEFLEILRTQLSDQMPEGKAAAHVRYYEDYFAEQMRKGRSEAEILGELGDPRLIARTILDTDPETEKPVYNGGAYGPEDRRNDYDRMNQEHVKRHTYRLDLTTWYGKIIVIVIAVAAVACLLFIIGTILPVILIAGLVLYLISWLRKKR